MRIVKLTPILLLTLCSVASASSYRVYIIDPLPANNFVEAFSINNSGTVLVSSSSAPNDTRGAFTWNAQSGIETVFTLGTVDFPQSINNNGQVVGVSDDGHIKTAIVYNMNGTFTNLASLQSETSSWAASINDNGQVVGCSGDAEHAVIWNANGMPVVIGGISGQRSCASDINYSGEVVWNSSEYTDTGLASSAYRWTSASNSDILNPLGNNGYTIANAINNDGLVVGQSGNNAVLWGKDNIATDLGTSGWAADINAYGWIVGALGDHAVLWNSDLTTFDLGSLVDADYSCALGINDNRWIVGYADISNTRRAVLWEPVPEPSSILALLCGISGMSALVWCKRKS